MTLVSDARWRKRYVNPGTDDDGYEEPEWSGGEELGGSYGGRGDWLYVFWLGEEPDVVDLLWLGEEQVQRLREDLQDLA